MKQYKFAVTLERDGDRFTVLPVAQFEHVDGTYGNGYYMKLANAGLGLQDVFDCRYDKRLNRNDLAGYVERFMKDMWNGKNGACLLVECRKV